MEILILLFKSGIQLDEIVATSESRADQYRKVKGLLQKYYVSDPATEHLGGVFLFDSKENLEAFRESQLAKSTAEAYKFTEPPRIQILTIMKQLREEKSSVAATSKAQEAVPS